MTTTELQLYDFAQNVAESNMFVAAQALVYEFVKISQAVSYLCLNTGVESHAIATFWQTVENDWKEKWESK